MKLILYCAMFLSVFLISPVYAVDESPNNVKDELIKTQLEQLPTNDIKRFWTQLQEEYGPYLEDFNSANIFETLLSPHEGWGLKSFFTAFAKYFFHEVVLNLDLLGSIVILAVFSVLLRTLQNAFEQQQISKVAYAIVFMVIMVIAVKSFSVAMDTAKVAIGRMVDMMFALVPLLLSLLAAIGNIGSAALFHPLIIFMIHVISTLIYTVVLPLLFFATVLSIVSSITDKYKLDQLSDLLQKISIALMGGALTLFLGVISIQGATTSISDGVTIRTAKYITGNFVPVIGRTISDAADTVVGASLLVKNTVGLAGVIILLVICAFPALKILSLAFVYKLSAAIMQPLGSSPVVDSLSAIGKTLLYVFAALAIVGLMFFLSITIIIASGNISMMMR